jgi:hypothetical protein
VVVEASKEAAELHARGGKSFRWRRCCQDVVNGDEKVEDSGDADDDPGPGDEDECLPAPLSCNVLPPSVMDSEDFFEMETLSTAGREKSTAGVVMGVTGVRGVVEPPRLFRSSAAATADKTVTPQPMPSSTSFPSEELDSQSADREPSTMTQITSPCSPLPSAEFSPSPHTPTGPKIPFLKHFLVN